LRQAQDCNNLGNGFFGKADANKNGSISEDEWSAFQSTLTAQMQGSQSSSGSGSVSTLLNFMQNPTQIGTTNTSSTSSGNTVDDTFSKIDTNGDGSISKKELATFSSSLTDQLLAGQTTSGSSTSDQTSILSTTAALMQQAIGKYMSLTPAGQGISLASSLLGIGYPIASLNGR